MLNIKTVQTRRLYFRSKARWCLFRETQDLFAQWSFNVKLRVRITLPLLLVCQVKWLWNSTASSRCWFL